MGKYDMKTDIASSNKNLCVMGGKNLSLYILKAVCAIFVVFIHVPGISFEGMALQPLLRIAVPCFLMISGYYIVGDASCIDTERVKRQMRKILRLFIVGNITFVLFLFAKNIILHLPIIPDEWLTDI